MKQSKMILAAAGVGAVVAARALQRRHWFPLEGKVVAITGGSRGLGLVLAREFAGAGARLALLARNEKELEQARQDLASRGAEVIVVSCDIRERENVHQACAEILEKYGRIDVLVNVAGVIQVGPLEHMQLEDFENAMKVHYWGPLYAMLAVAPQMRKQGGGRILNISSIGGLVAIPHLLPYSASKFALVGLSDGMRAELARDNIRVTTVCPGLMRTGSHLNAQFKGQHQDEFAWFSLGNALPISSTSAQRAARQILQACQRGDTRLVITIQARALSFMSAVFPGITAEASALINRLLPAPTGQEGDQLKSGWESQSSRVPSAITVLIDRAVDSNNERIAAGNGKAHE